MKYYYFAATLPTLTLDTPPPWSAEDFRELCREHLCADDLAALDEVLGLAPETGRHTFVREWRNAETRLRNALAKARAGRLHRDAAPYLREQEGIDAQLERTVSEAFAKGDPLDRERSLDRFRWHRIENLAGYDPFSARAVLAFGLKLLLAGRWAALRDESGWEKVEELIQREPEPARE
jgi:hypothetical protein